MVKIILFEGIDGCGKSTQVDLMNEYLKMNKKKVRNISFPTNSTIGAYIRRKIKHSKPNENVLDVYNLSLLFLADMFETMNDIEDEDFYDHYILDRYYLSSLVYQTLHYEGVVKDNLNVLSPVKFTKILESIIKLMPKPDICFIIDVTPEMAIERIREREKFVIDKDIYENIEFLTKARELYIQKGTKDKKAIIIDGQQNPKAIHTECIQLLNLRRVF
jgi:dTMP kinase